MSDISWTRTILESQVTENTPQVVSVGEKEVLLLRVRGRIRALPQECPHYHKALSKGVLTVEPGDGGRTVLTCHSHFARFDAETGDLMGPPALDHLACYDVRIEDGIIHLAPAKRVQFGPIPEGDTRVFVIVGGGAAAEIAAETLRREGFGGRILMITREKDRPYDRPNLTKDYITGEAKPSWMPLRSEKFYQNRRIEVLTGRTAVGLEQGVVHLDGGESMAYDRLLLATGMDARKLEVPGADLEGCTTLRSMEDGVRLVAALERARRVVIVGASFVGMEAASAIRRRGIEVDVVAPETLPLASLLGERVGKRLLSFAERAGVRFHLGTTVARLEGNGRVELVVLANGETLPADHVLVGIGVRPATGFLVSTGLLRDGAVPVGQDLQTAWKGAYAAGDIASVEGRRVEHWVVAQRQGQLAALSMLGKPVRYAEIPFFWTAQFGHTLKYVGHAVRPERTVYVGDVEEGKFLAGYYVSGRLAAAAGIGRAQDLVRIHDALGRGADIPPATFERGVYTEVGR